MAKNQTIVIDIVARFKDEVTDNINILVNTLNKGLSSAQNSVNGLSNTFFGVRANVDTLNNSITTVQQSTDSLGNAANSTQSNINNLDSSIDNAQASTTGLSNGFNRTQRNATDLGNSINTTRRNNDRFTASMQRAQQQAQRLTRDRWLIRLEAVDRSAQSIAKVTASVSKLTGKTFSFTMKMIDLATKPLQGLFKMASNPIVAFGSIAGVSVGVKDTVDTFANFEQTMANVKAITKSSASDFKELKDTAMHLGETTVFSAAEVAQGMTYLGMAGWKKDSIKEAMPGLLDLSVAGQTDLATTSDIISDVMTAFKIDPTLKTDRGISNTTHVADVFANTVTGSNTNVTMLGETMKYAAPIAKEFQMTLEETAAISGMMANAGIKSSQAGTTLRGAVTRLAKKPEQAEKELNRFGIKLSDRTGNIRPIADIVTDLSDSFSHLTQEEKLASASKIFGTNALSGWLTVLDQGPDVLREFTKSMYDADGAAKKMADIELDTLQGSFKLLQSAAEGLKIRIGTRLSPVMRKFTDDVTSSIPELERAISKGIDIASEKLKMVEQNVNKLKQSMDWKTADTFSDKFSLAWDKIIEEPFHKWWSSSGQNLMADIANKIGNGLGGLYRGGIGLLFGFSDSNGKSVGQSFAEGFLAGFKPEDTARKVIDGFKNIFSKSHFNIFADKEDKSIVNTLISGFMLTKGLQLTSSIAGGVSTGARTIGGLIGGGISPSMVTSVPIATQPLLGLGIGGAGGAGLSSIVMPVAMATSFVSATGGLVSAVSDFSDATNTQNKKLKRDYTSRGAAKLGMVGIGAAIGSVIPGIGNIAGALIGAGLGGLGALIKGNDLGDWISDVSDGTKNLDKMAESFKRTKEQADKMRLQDLSIQGLVDEYYNLDDKIRLGNLSVDERVQLEDRQRGILQNLSEIYPDIINNYDIQNGKLYKTLEDIKKISKMDKEIANAELQVKGVEAQQSFPELKDRYYKSKDEEQNLQDTYITKKDNLIKYNSLYNEASLLQKDIIKAYKLGDEETVNEKTKELNYLLTDVATLAASNNDNIAVSDVASLGASIKSFRVSCDKALDSLIAQQEETANLKSEMSGNLDIMQRQVLAANGLDGNFEEVSKTYDSMTEKQRANYQQAKEEYQDILNMLGDIPKELEVLIRIDTFYESYGDPYLQDCKKYGVSWHSPYAERDIEIAKEEENSKNIYANKILKLENKATGGILTKPSFGWVAEAGPEAIIPLAGSHKSRGKELWLQTGELLGLNRDKEQLFDRALYHASGGIFSNKHIGIIGEAGPEAIIPLAGSHKNRGKDIWQQVGINLGMFDNQSQPSKCYVQPLDFGSDSETNNSNRNIAAPISISLGGINITLNGSTDFSNSRSIVNAIRAELPEITNDLCEQMARMLQQVFDNMTLEA